MLLHNPIALPSASSPLHQQPPPSLVFEVLSRGPAVPEICGGGAYVRINQKDVSRIALKEPPVHPGTSEQHPETGAPSPARRLRSGELKN
ncbi:hypothetical protein PBY51_018022 [Eleginops maclovinus]|nr:hypothetical protein PBY51_018022 [Eleginops maclovinus]